MKVQEIAAGAKKTNVILYVNETAFKKLENRDNLFIFLYINDINNI